MKSTAIRRRNAHSLVALLFFWSLDGWALDAAFTQLEPLRGNVGYLLFDHEVQRDAAELRLNASVNFHLSPGRQLHILPLKAGRYQWQSLSVPYYDLPYRLRLKQEATWSFSIEAGKINYVGRVVVDSWRATDSISVRLLNRSGMLFIDFPEELDALLRQYPLVYAGPLRDDFVETYQQLRSGAKAPAAPR